MDMGFAVIGQLARHPYASDPVLVHRLARLLHASFRPRLATTPLRFAIFSPPSGCEKDFHLRAVEHARHTNKKAGSPEPASDLRLKGVPPEIALQPRVSDIRFGPGRQGSMYVRTICAPQHIQPLTFTRDRTLVLE